MRLDDLLSQGTISRRDREELGTLLRTVEDCDFDSCRQMEELVHEVTRTLTAWQEVFSLERLERLRQVI
jgi:hypothetical protein